MRRWLLRGHIGVLATLMPLAVRLVTVQRLVRLLTPPRWLRPYAAVTAPEMAGFVAHRLRRPRMMRRRTCLRQGLVLFHFLRLAGLPAAVHFGIFSPATDPRRLHGHCWVTLGDVCLSPPPEEPVAVLLSRGGESN